MNSNEPRAIVELTYDQLIILAEALGRLQPTKGWYGQTRNSALDLVENAINILDNEHDDNG